MQRAWANILQTDPDISSHQSLRLLPPPGAMLRWPSPSCFKPLAPRRRPQQHTYHLTLHDGPSFSSRCPILSPVQRVKAIERVMHMFISSLCPCVARGHVGNSSLVHVGFRSTSPAPLGNRTSLTAKFQATSPYATRGTELQQDQPHYHRVSNHRHCSGPRSRDIDPPTWYFKPAAAARPTTGATFKQAVRYFVAS